MSSVLSRLLGLHEGKGVFAKCSKTKWDYFPHFCSTTGSMWTLLRWNELHSNITIVVKKSQTRFYKSPPAWHTILKWVKNFISLRNVEKKTGQIRQPFREQTVQTAKSCSCQHITRSLRNAVPYLWILHCTIHNERKRRVYMFLWR